MTAQSYYLLTNGPYQLITDDTALAEAYARDGCEVNAMSVSHRNHGSGFGPQTTENEV